MTIPASSILQYCPKVYRLNIRLRILDPLYPNPGYANNQGFLHPSTLDAQSCVHCSSCRVIGLLAQEDSILKSVDDGGGYPPADRSDGGGGGWDN